MLYLRVFLIARISTLYRTRLFTSAINYVNPLLGWIFFFMGLFGLLYIFRHPLRSYEIMQAYGPIFIFMLGFLVFSIIAKMALPIIYHWKTKTTHHYGGLAKMIWSYLLFFLYSIAIGPIYMAQFTRMLYYWVKGEKIQWGEQNRDDRSLSWGEAFHHFWWLSALGCVLFWLVTHYVFAADTVIVQEEMKLPKWDLLFWYVPMLFGMITSVWLARFLSLEIPALETLGWFQSPQEVEPHFVLQETQRLLPIMEARIPETVGLHEAVEDPWFYRRHREMCMDRPVKFAFWSARLRGRRLDDLTPGEARIMLNERGLYDAAHHAIWIAE
jgi:membrane glycosyltransferase